jgi:hypothetical protein
MNIGWCHGKAPDNTMFSIDTNTVLIAIVIDAILFSSSGHLNSSAAADLDFLPIHLVGDQP